MQGANLNGRDCPEPRGVVSAQNETDFFFFFLAATSPTKFSDPPPPMQHVSVLQNPYICMNTR